MLDSLVRQGGDFVAIVKESPVLAWHDRAKRIVSARDVDTGQMAAVAEAVGLSYDCGTKKYPGVRCDWMWEVATDGLSADRRKLFHITKRGKNRFVVYFCASPAEGHKLLKVGLKLAAADESPVIKEDGDGR
jgi:hypothetical protein